MRSGLPLGARGESPRRVDDEESPSARPQSPISRDAVGHSGRRPASATGLTPRLDPAHCPST